MSPKGFLLTCRNDDCAGKGSYIPGGIVRFRKKIEDRIINVGHEELKITINEFNGPISTNEIFLKKQLERSHFISLLYDCKIGDEQFLKL
jgi:hypothetical protein